MMFIGMMLRREIPPALPVAEKIKRFRKSRGITQAEIAEAVWSSPTKISQVENGEGEYTTDQLNNFRLTFGLVNMPLTEFECTAFKQRLYHWRGLISNGNMAEAEQLREEMAAIVNLDPCDYDLPMLFRLFEIILLHLKNDVAAAKAKLKFLIDAEDNMSDEHRFFYYSIRGWLDGRNNRFESALKFYLKAFEVTELYKDFFSTKEVERLHYNIATCYSKLEKPNRVLMFVNKVYTPEDEGKITLDGLRMNIALALNYSRIGASDEAEKLLNQCLIHANAINDKSIITLTLYNLGLLYKSIGKWISALEYLEQALDVCDIGSNDYLWITYHKIYCVIGNRKFADAARLLERAEKIYDKDKDEAIPFKALGHYLAVCKGMSYNQDKAADYIETVAVPYFKKNNVRFEAINYYRLLEAHYKMVRSNANAAIMGRIIRDFYHEIFVSN